MSIVLEALEKAQKENRGGREKKPISGIRLIEPAPFVKTKRSFLRHRFLFWVPILGIGLLSLVFLGLKINSSRVLVDHPGVSIDNLPKGFSVTAPESPSQRNVGAPADPYPQERIEEDFPQLTITGVVWDSLEPIVLVNGKFLREGDQISGVVVKEIQIHQVKFLYKDKEFIVATE